MPNDNQELRRRAAQLYVAWTQVEEPQTMREPIPTLGDLVAWLVEGKPLKPEQLPLLFSNQRLRADFQRLKDELRIREMPAVRAAKSHKELNDRPITGGGKVQRWSDPDGMLVYVQITMPDSADKPGAFLVEGPGGKMAREKLDPPNDKGEILLIKDLANEIDRLFVELLRNAASTGTFLKVRA